MIRVRPFKGKYLTRNQANKINNGFLSAQVPDRTELEKEANEFIKFIRNKRAQSKQ